MKMMAGQVFLMMILVNKVEHNKVRDSKMEDIDWVAGDDENEFEAPKLTEVCLGFPVIH